LANKNLNHRAPFLVAPPAGQDQCLPPHGVKVLLATNHGKWEKPQTMATQENLRV